MFTDHAFLVYLFDPYDRNPGMSRHTASNLMRWATKLSTFRYAVQNLPGEGNVWVDMLTRWAVASPAAVKAKRMPLKALIAPISPSLDSKMDYPSIRDIWRAQSESELKPRKRFTRHHDCWKDFANIICIPNENTLLKLRIMVAGHAASSGHRGWRASKTTVAEHFYWDGMDTDVESFVKPCIHCL